MRIGRIVAAEPLLGAPTPTYQLWIDLGPALGLAQSHVQAGVSLQDGDTPAAPAELVGRLVVVVVNLPPTRIALWRSEVVVLGAVGESGRIVLLTPMHEVPLDTRVR